jgi:hypothetical protein
MAIRKVPRDPERLELLRLYGALQPEQAVGSSLAEPARMNEFLARARRSLEGSLASPSRLYGVLGQAMFRATVVALGQLRLLADEDAGDPYYDDADGELSPPDFRVVDADGKTLLIEVKTARLDDPTGPLRLRAKDVETWRRWGVAVGVPVKLAVWWVVPGLWTLVDLERLRAVDSKREITLPEAMTTNEMSSLGDRMVATLPPLTLRLGVELIERDELDGSAQVDTRIREVTLLAGADKLDGSAQVDTRIREVTLLAGADKLDDELERRIAWFLLSFGEWEIERHDRVNADGLPVVVDLVARPPEHQLDAVAQQGFMVVGAMSTLYGRLFLEATLAQGGEVAQLDHPPDPGELAELLPADFWAHKGRKLRLWSFILEPADLEATHPRGVGAERHAKEGGGPAGDG